MKLLFLAQYSKGAADLRQNSAGGPAGKKIAEYIDIYQVDQKLPPDNFLNEIFVDDDL